MTSLKVLDVHDYKSEEVSGVLVIQTKCGDRIRAVLNSAPKKLMLWAMVNGKHLRFIFPIHNPSETGDEIYATRRFISDIPDLGRSYVFTRIGLVTNDAGINTLVWCERCHEKTSGGRVTFDVNLATKMEME